MNHATVADMPRPPTDAVQIAIRVPKAWTERADRLIPTLSKPGVTASRTDVFRAAMARGFEEFERDQARQAAEAK